MGKKLKKGKKINAQRVRHLQCIMCVWVSERVRESEYGYTRQIRHACMCAWPTKKEPFRLEVQAMLSGKDSCTHSIRLFVLCIIHDSFQLEMVFSTSFCLLYHIAWGYRWGQTYKTKKETEKESESEKRERQTDGPIHLSLHSSCALGEGCFRYPPRKRPNAKDTNLVKERKKRHSTRFSSPWHCWSFKWIACFSLPCWHWNGCLFSPSPQKLHKKTKEKSEKERERAKLPFRNSDCATIQCWTIVSKSPFIQHHNIPFLSSESLSSLTFMYTFSS